MLVVEICGLSSFALMILPLIGSLDLWMNCWQVATIAEQPGRSDARDWWRKAHDTRAAMKQRGIMLPTDEPNLAELRQKVGV